MLAATRHAILLNNVRTAKIGRIHLVNFQLWQMSVSYQTGFVLRHIFSHTSIFKTQLKWDRNIYQNFSSYRIQMNLKGLACRLHSPQFHLAVLVSTRGRRLCSAVLAYYLLLNSPCFRQFVHLLMPRQFMESQSRITHEFSQGDHQSLELSGISRKLVFRRRIHWEHFRAGIFYTPMSSLTHTNPGFFIWQLRCFPLTLVKFKSFRQSFHTIY